jgi:hypothetical protein
MQSYLQTIQFNWPDYGRYRNFGYTESFDLNKDELGVLLNTPLWQAVYKIQWADRQFVDALNHFQSYLDEKRIGLKEITENGVYKYVIYSDRITMFFPILIGSGIHALRSALDTAISVLVEGVSGERPDRVSFPFYETEQQLRSSFQPSTRFCSKCHARHEQKPYQEAIIKNIPELQDLIVESFRPWKAGNYYLWALNKLDNIQKHRSLLIALSNFQVSVDFISENFVNAKGNLWIINPGQEMTIYESNNPIYIANNVGVSANPTLYGEMPLAGDNLFEGLGQMYKETRLVLIKLYEAFKDHKAMS